MADNVLLGSMYVPLAATRVQPDWLTIPAVLRNAAGIGGAPTGRAR
jgi:hypothetical protein